MTVEEFQEKFHPLSPHGKIRFLYSHIESLSRKERILFLLSLLKEVKTSPLVKATALKFLREAAHPEFEIYQHYVDDPFRAVANAAKRAVKEFEAKGKKNRYYTESVLRKLASLENKERRLKILKAIAKLKASWVLKVLLESLSDPCEIVRDFLIQELSQREIWDLDPLYERLRKPPWYAKSAILKILARRKESSALPRIESVLADPNVDVRKCAAEALGEIGGKAALSLLVRLTKDESAHVRAAAAEALRKASQVRFSG